VEFKYNLRELQFILKEWLPTEKVLAFDRFRDNFSLEDVDMYLNEGYRIAREVVNPINAVGDAEGSILKDGTVTPPTGFADVYKFLQENGWGSTSECVQLDGGMPLILYKALFEMNTAACPAITSYIKLTSGAANLLIKFGTDEDRQRYLPKMLSGDWQGTMCLTEPNAGSDVGDSTARSYPTDDPRIWKIKGTKMFITAGDAGTCENTIHMVLARPEGGAPGTAGLGLYIVPKYRVNEDGSMGAFNDVTIVGLEHKMGLKGHATSLLNFGENDDCYGIMMGPPPNEKGRSRGLAMMFNMMNESRIGTGHNSNTQAAAAYSYASRYATERIQGRTFGEKGGERVPIIKHEDIRRMLLDMKAVTEGVRAMIFKSFYYLDIEANSPDKEEAKRYGGLAAVLMPLVKGFGSESSLAAIAQAIQVLGGVGYTREYPVEQYLRDSKILTIWEGTTFIQANDLVGRKMRMNEGAVFADWMKTIKDFIDEHSDHPQFQAEMRRLGEGYNCVERVRERLAGWYEQFEQKKRLIPSNAVSAMTICAQVQVAQCLMEQAVIAQARIAELPEDHFDRPFYLGKVAAARYWANRVLPQTALATELLEAGDTICIDCPEEALIVD